MSDLDPAAIMAEHERIGHATCAVCDGDDWPCLPYLLAEALAVAAERERRGKAKAWDQGALTAMHHAGSPMPGLYGLNPYRAATTEGDAR